MALGGGGGSRGIRAGAAYVELSAKDNLTKQLKAIAGKFADFGKAALAATGVGGIVGGILGGLGFKDSIDELTRMKTAIDAMGMSATGGSGLFGVLNQFGDLGENVEGLTQFAQKVQDAFDGVGGGGGEAAELFKGLSVTAKDLVDLPLEEKFLAIHGAIRELPQAQQQFKLSMLGGTDSMKKWLPLLSMSNDELRAQAKNLAFGSAELEDAAAASKAMKEAQAQIGRAWQQATVAIAPLVTDGARFVTEVLKPIGEWTRGRTLAMVWDEVSARAAVAWEEIKQAGRVAIRDTLSTLLDFTLNLPATLKGAWDGVWSGMTTGFSAAVIQVTAIFNEMLDRMRAAARQAFVALAVAAASPNPMDRVKLLAAPLALPVLGAQGVKEVMDRVAPEVAKLGMGAAAGIDQLKRAALDAIDVNKGQADLDAARAKLAAVLADIAAGRAVRRGDGAGPVAPGLAPLEAKLEGVRKSLGTFGAGSFLKQGFGVQSAGGLDKKLDVGKKLAAKQVDLLGKLEQKAKPLVFT